MLRSSWAFKNSPFFAPETDEGSNRPLRHLAELQCSMSGRDRMAFRSCLDDSKLCSYCIRNRHRHIESFLGNNLKDLCHRTTYKIVVTFQGYLTVFSESCRTRDSQGKKHTRFPTVLHTHPFWALDPDGNLFHLDLSWRRRLLLRDSPGWNRRPRLLESSVGRCQSCCHRGAGCWWGEWKNPGRERLNSLNHVQWMQMPASKVAHGRLPAQLFCFKTFLICAAVFFITAYQP